MLTCDGDDNINTAKRERRHAPRPEAGSGRGTGMGQSGVLIQENCMMILKYLA